MFSVRRAAWGAMLAGAVVTVTGCGDGGKDMQIDQLNDKVAALTRERDDLRNALAAAANDRRRLQGDNDQLRQELENARGQISALEKIKLPPGWEISGGVAWTNIAEDILFDSGKADLKATGKTKLREVAGQIKNTQGLSTASIWVVGHTDTDPIRVSKDKWIDNLDLSVNRGAVVVRELYGMGLDPRGVTAGGQGEHNPIAPNDTPANKHKNRRVQIIAIPRPQAIEPLRTPPAAREMRPATPERTQPPPMDDSERGGM